MTDMSLLPQCNVHIISDTQASSDGRRDDYYPVFLLSAAAFKPAPAGEQSDASPSFPLHWPRSHMSRARSDLAPQCPSRHHPCAMTLFVPKWGPHPFRVFPGVSGGNNGTS